MIAVMKHVNVDTLLEYQHDVWASEEEVAIYRQKVVSVFFCERLRVGAQRAGMQALRLTASSAVSITKIFFIFIFVYWISVSLSQDQAVA